MMLTVEFMLYPGALGLDVTGPLEVFHTATRILQATGRGGSGYGFLYSSSSPGPVRLSSGLNIVADSGLDDRQEVDILLVPGGDLVSGTKQDTVLVSHIRKRADNPECRIVSVCKGAFLLAAAGILKGKRAACHWSSAGDLAGCFPEIRVDAEAIFVRDGRIYTSAGVTAGIDLALALVEEDHGSAVAVETARQLVLYYRRPGSQCQYSAPLAAESAAGKRFADLHAWLLTRLVGPITVEMMADVSAMSPRHFSRVFRNETGITPARYLETLRLDRARELLTRGADSMARIAEECGFGREDRLRRAFLRHFGISPSQYRLHFHSSGHSNNER